MAGRRRLCCCCCSPKAILLLLLATAIPAAYLIRLETAAPPGHAYEYSSPGWMRECSKWDHVNNSRFIVSFFEGGIGVVDVSPEAGGRLEEVAVVKDADYAGNSSLGFVIDGDRNRAVVAVADVFGNRYSAVAAYDLTTWERIFLTRLSGPGDEKSMADDVTIDEEGNSYITDTKGSKLWKVGPTGELLATIRHPLLNPPGFLNKQVGLNGILYHPNRFLLAIHTMSGNLYKVTGLNSPELSVQVVEIAGGGSLRFGDGLQFLTPERVVVAGNPTRLIESSDDWVTAKVVGVAKGKSHRIVTAATLKDGRVYLNHFMGLGYPTKKHVLIEAIFQ